MEVITAWIVQLDAAVGCGVGFVGVHASLTHGIMHACVWNLDLSWICATCAHGYSEQGKDSVKVPRLPENMPSSQGCVSRVGMLLLHVGMLE